MTKIIKRDGRIVPFTNTRISHAINLAMQSVGINKPEVSEKIANDIADVIKGTTKTVEEIQDMVENALMNEGFNIVAKNYILYRNKRSHARETNSKLTKTVMEKLDGSNKVNSNANVNEEAFDGRKKEASDALQKIIALDMNMSEDISAAHHDGYIYQHDLSEYNIGEHNCLFLDIDKLFKGFKTRNGSVRAPGSFSCACQLFAVACQCQSQV